MIPSLCAILFHLFILRSNENVRLVANPPLGTCLYNLSVFSVPRRWLSWRVHLAEWTQYLAQWIQQRKISQTERFCTKNALEVWKQILVWPYVFYDDATQF